MIPFTLQDEPPEFHVECRIKGNQWLSENPNYDRPRDFWTPFRPALRRAFREMCGWCAMYISPSGQVDHFKPVAILKRTNEHEKAYEWSNLRYIDPTINQKKQCVEKILDPFDVKDGWFEITLPSLQLLPTDKIPDEHRALAEFTLKRLGLRDGEFIIDFRQGWFELYQRNEITL